MRTRRNPLGASAFAPILPWVIGGVVIYLYWDKILTAIGSKLTGVSTEQYKQDVSTVKSALLSPVETGKEIVRYVTGTQASAGAPVMVKGKQVAVPYPNPKSNEEFRANIAAINQALGKTTGA